MCPYTTPWASIWSTTALELGCLPYGYGPFLLEMSCMMLGDGKYKQGGHSRKNRHNPTQTHDKGSILREIRGALRGQ